MIYGSHSNSQVLTLLEVTSFSLLLQGRTSLLSPVPEPNVSSDDSVMGHHVLTESAADFSLLCLALILYKGKGASTN